MKRIAGCPLLILGLILLVPSASAQQASHFEHWHTAGVGLSTPLGFNAGASYSLRVAGPLFVQLSASATKDIYVTKHSVYAVGPSVGVRHYTDVALVSLSAGPTYVRGTRGADLRAAGLAYETTAVNVIGQVLFRDLRMGFEVYTNFNPVRNVSGMRLIYRLGSIR